MYLGGKKEENIPIKLFPLRSDKPSDLAGLPPHCEYPVRSPQLIADFFDPPKVIWSMEIDIYVEHGPAYALKLLAADVPVELRVSRSTIHSYLWIVPDSDLAKETREEYVKQTKRALA